VASNPAVYFFSTLSKKEVPYDREAARRAYPILASYLRLEEPDPERLTFARRLEPHPCPGSGRIGWGS
jgi:hypothetical protein